MKKYALLLLVSLMVTSCQQELLNTPEEETPTRNVKKHSACRARNLLQESSLLKE